jgi:K+-sensing histidine kinase KdpD
VQLYLETIKKRELSEETKNKLLDGMLGENQRLKSLVDNFLASARLSYSERPYIFSPLAVSELLGIFLKGHGSLLNEVRIRETILEDTPISVDTEAMNLVFSNLVENAIHYSADVPQVEIEAWREKNTACIRFSDSGIGIAKERYRDIFKMFQRLPEAMALWGSGTGMGLYVVKAIIKAHGGTIKVTEGKTNTGTSFLIRLPVARQ